VFGLFKSGRSDLVHESVLRVGNDLHRQVKVAVVEIKKSSNSEAFKRMESAFTAGYLFGYIQSAFSGFSLSEKDMNLCMKEVCDGIFPDRGYSFVRSKVDRLQNADDAGMNISIEHLAEELGAGIDSGRRDADAVLTGEHVVVTGLSVYLLTGRFK